MGELDRTITLAINGLHCPTSDAFWIFLSDKVTTAVIYIIVLAIMFWKLGWKKALFMLLTTAIILGLEDQICNIIKDFTARLRPGNDPIMLERGLYLPIPASARQIHGFPSAHAANAFGFLTCATMFFMAGAKGRFGEAALQPETGKVVKWVVGVLSVWAFLISLSRVFLARHYAGDILFGGFLGWILAFGGCMLAFYLWRRYSKK